MWDKIGLGWIIIGGAMQFLKCYSIYLVIFIAAINANANDKNVAQPARAKTIAGSPAQIKLSAAEKYNAVSSSVAYWFDYTPTAPSDSGNQEEWRKIEDAMNKVVYGDNEFEINRDSKNVGKRLADVKAKLFGLKVLIEFPEYSFKTKTYSFSARSKDGPDGLHFIGRKPFPPVRIDVEKAEEIKAVNERGYYQEIVFRMDRVVSDSEASAEFSKGYGAYMRVRGYINAKIVGSKITIAGYGDIYPQ